MAKPKTRDDFPSEVKELLARRAGYRCSICEDPTVGPHSDDERSVYLGEASHICSAAPNGPRANPKLTAAERTAALNGIHLCKTHARLIDVDVNSYTVERLNEIKLTHERKVRALIVGTNGEFDAGFLNSHETQIMHGRGEPSLSDLWVHRSVMQFRRGQVPLKRDAVNLIEVSREFLHLPVTNGPAVRPC